MAEWQAPYQGSLPCPLPGLCYCLHLSALSTTLATTVALQLSHTPWLQPGTTTRTGICRYPVPAGDQGNRPRTTSPTGVRGPTRSGSIWQHCICSQPLATLASPCQPLYGSVTPVSTKAYGQAPLAGKTQQPAPSRHQEDTATYGTGPLPSTATTFWISPLLSSISWKLCQQLCH